MDQLILTLIAILASIGLAKSALEFVKGLTGPDDPDYDYKEYKGDE